MLTKIISGGQTGADQGALHGARLAGLETGGAAPKGYWTENGREPTLLRGYGLIETVAMGYPPRTRINAMNSDGTLIFGDPESRGSNLTIKYCNELKKPFRIVLWRRDKPRPAVYLSVVQWIEMNNIKILNVAGNRESKNLGIHEATSQFIVGLIEELELVEELKKDQTS